LIQQKVASTGHTAASVTGDGCSGEAAALGGAVDVLACATEIGGANSPLAVDPGRAIRATAAGVRSDVSAAVYGSATIPGSALSVVQPD